MSETNEEMLNVDPPENQGGGGAAALNLEPAPGTEPVDPPDNNGGTGG